MMTKCKALGVFSLLAAVLIFPLAVYADVDIDSAIADPSVTGRLENIGAKAGLTRPYLATKGADQSTALPEYLGRVIFGLMSLLGVIFFALMVYGGFLWLYAGGNDEHVKKAQNIIKMAFIGFVIVLFAGGIVQFVMYYGSK